MLQLRTHSHTPPITEVVDASAQWREQHFFDCTLTAPLRVQQRAASSPSVAQFFAAHNRNVLAMCCLLDSKDKVR